MNNLDKSYQSLLSDILTNGVKKEDRTGTGTISVFGRQIRHKMSEGFPLLTTKKMARKAMEVELKWFLQGNTNIQFLVQNNCNIWNGDAYKNFIKKNDIPTIENSDNIIIHVPPEEYLSNEVVGLLTEKEFINKIKTDDLFAKEWGDLGPIYGKQWRSWNSGKDIAVKTGETYPSGQFKYDFTTEKIDQITNLINDLKNNPDSRRLMVNAWNVAEIDKAVLPPCHYGFQVWTKELSFRERWFLAYGQVMDSSTDEPFIKGGDIVPSTTLPEYWDKMGVPKRSISLMWNQRSVDTFLGLPFNIASYGLLLMLIGKEVNMVPDELIGNLGDTHLYLNHIEQAKEQISRKPYELPILEIQGSEFNIYDINLNNLVLKNYVSHEKIEAPLSN